MKGPAARRTLKTPAGQQPAVVAEEAADRFELRELLGRGATGEVYRAYDRKLQREVALKRLQRSDPAQEWSLLKEARAQARVSHPHVCPVYEVGYQDGTAFVALRLVRGGTLSAAAAALPLEQKIELLRKAALAVHAAHLQGLVHRDVKPANILVEADERGALQPYVTDFGLAREADASAASTLAGTPSYMSPEQARGEPVDCRTDVYSLGATLFELVSGRVPHPAPDAAEAIRLLLQGETPLLRELWPRVPRDLEAVVSQCLERDPARRYPSALELAADLQRLLVGRPVSARRTGLLRRKAALLRRHPRALAASAAALLVALAALGWAGRAARAARQRAEAAERFGREAGALEGRLRIAYMLPLHDTRAERAELRAELGSLEQQAAWLGGLARGPALLALGRAWLALGDLEPAERDLRAAGAAGESGEAWARALGVALARRYLAGVREAARLPAELRAARRQELDEQLKRPALQALAAVTSDDGAALVARGWLAFLEGDEERALRLAGKARARSSDRPEAAQLSLTVESERIRRDRTQGQYADGEAVLVKARAELEEAVDQARSHPDLALAACHLWATVLDLRVFGTATADVEGASRGVDQWCARARSAGAEGPEPFLAEALVHRSLAGWTLNRGADPKPEIDRALASLQQAEQQDPQAHQALSLEASVLDLAGMADLRWGRDATADLRASLERAARARLLGAGAELRSTTALAHTHLALWLARHGWDPRAEVAAGLAEYQQQPESTGRLINRGGLHELVANWLGRHGEDPSTAWASCLSDWEQAAARDPALSNRINLALAHLERAAWAQGHQRPVEADLAEAREQLRQVADAAPRFGVIWVLRGTAARAEAELALRAGRALAPQEAEESFRTAAQMQPDDPEAYGELAEVALQRARSAADDRAAATRWLDEALRQNGRALQRDGTLESAWLQKARILGLRGAVRRSGAALAEAGAALERARAIGRSGSELLQVEAQLAVAAALGVSPAAPARTAAERALAAARAADPAWAGLASLGEALAPVGRAALLSRLVPLARAW
jgi:serine/threonine-protein kinase